MPKRKVVVAEAGSSGRWVFPPGHRLRAARTGVPIFPVSVPVSVPSSSLAAVPMSGVVMSSSAPRVGYSSVARARGAAVTGEMKYYDAELTATAITVITTTWGTTNFDPATSIALGDPAVATPACLCCPITSAAVNGRVGRKIYIYKVKVRGLVAVPNQSTGATSDAACKVRIMLVLDKQTNSAQAAGTALMQGGGGASSTINSFQNVSNFGRFNVLKDKQFIFGNTSMTGAAAAIEQSGMKRPFKLNWKFKTPLVMHFQATNGGTVADVTDNSLHIFAACDSAGLAPTLAYYSRVCYKDV